MKTPEATYICTAFKIEKEMQSLPTEFVDDLKLGYFALFVIFSIIVILALAYLLSRRKISHKNTSERIFLGLHASIKRRKLYIIK